MYINSIDKPCQTISLSGEIFDVGIGAFEKIGFSERSSKLVCTKIRSITN